MKEKTEQKRGLARISMPAKAGRIMSAAALIIWPLLDFLISEAAMNTGCDYLHLTIYRLLMNIWWYYLAEGIILAITLNIRTAVEGGAIFCFVFSAVNIYLMEFRNIPLYMTDLVDIGTAGNVAGNYRLNLPQGVIILIVFLAVTVFVMHVIWPSGRKYIQKKRLIARLIAIPAMAAVTFISGYYISHSDFPHVTGIKLSSYRPIKSYIEYGGMLTFMRSSSMLIVEKPDGYSLDSVAKLDEQYISESASDNSVPNIIVVMNEALSDLQDVGSFETNEDPLSFIHSMTDNTIKGRLYTSVFGGHTANTEYEFLTGDSYALCPSGTPYVLYIKDFMPNLTSYVEESGSMGNIAMHPNVGSNYNRASVYSDFGFDEFLTIDDFTDAQTVRGFVSDKADYERIISEYEAAKADNPDDPFYLFNVTMQNHSPYNKTPDNLPDTIHITSDGVENREEAEQYLNLVRLSDEAAQELVTYFSGVDEPTIIVMFGDHEPGLSDEFYDSILPEKRSEMSDEEEMDLYHTVFFVWANFDIEEMDDVSISANYLQTLVKETAGMNLTGYDKFLSQMHEQIPVFCANGYLTADGDYYEVKDKDSEYWPLVNDYWILVYNHLLDRSHRASMFELAG